MICSNCYSQNGELQTYCVTCGAELSASGTMSVAEAPTPQPSEAKPEVPFSIAGCFGIGCVVIFVVMLVSFTGGFFAIHL